MTLVPEAAPPIDEEGLICALALAPSTYSRNRFFSLYQHPSMRRARRRASLVRSLARDLLRPNPHVLTVMQRDDGVFEVAIDVPELEYRRRAFLSPVEKDALDLVVARGLGREVPDVMARVEGALARLHSHDYG